MAARRNEKVQKRPDIIKWTLMVGAALVVAALAVMVYRHYRPNVNVDRYPIRGIDVSKHNGHIDWERVANQGVRFVYIKASEGATYRNPLFEEQYAGATRAGLKVGAYHFFRMNRSGAAQAEHFARTIGKRRFDMPIVIDVEESRDNQGVQRDSVVEQLKLMASTLENKGHQVMLYTNGNGYRSFYQGRLDQYDLWLSAFKAPERIAYIGHRIQQYSHWGSLDGVEGDVDLNVFVGSERQWQQWLDQVNVNTQNNRL